MMVPLLPLLLLAGCWSQGAGQSDDQYCLAKDHYPYLYFGPKTAYERVYDHKDSAQNVPSCTPMQIWLLARPGTHFPDPVNFAKMSHMLPGLREQILRNHEQRHSGTMCPEDINALMRWKLDVPDDKVLFLTGQGQADLSFLARRLKRRFPEILNVSYTPERFKFRFTDTQRTRESAAAFASGIFEYMDDLPAAVPNDPLLQFHEKCPAWQTEVRDNPEAFAEVRKFEEGPEMQQTIARVSRRLGFLYNQSMENIDLMWEMCRYDKAVRYISLSPWCSAFTEEDLKVMEYRADLQHYYNYSYGNELNVRMGCKPAKDMLDHFSQVEAVSSTSDGMMPVGEGPPPPAGIFYFTHDPALHMTMARLGIAKDTLPLTAGNYDQQTKRFFRTSLIGSFAGNLAAVFYQCTQGEKHRVMFYVRERIVEYEGCEVGLCSWAYIKSRLAKAAQDCDQGFCHGASAACPTVPAAPAVVASLVAFLLAKIAQ